MAAGARTPIPAGDAAALVLAPPVALLPPPPGRQHLDRAMRGYASAMLRNVKRAPPGLRVDRRA